MLTIGQIRGRVAGDPQLAGLLEAVMTRLSEQADSAHGLAHSMRVAIWTVEIGGEELDFQEAVAAALLHDVVAVRKDSPQRSSASELSAEVAKELLPRFGFDLESTTRIADAVRDHSYSRGAVPTSELGRALQDADRLEALGVIGAFRAVACGVDLGGEIFDPEDPWSEERALDEKRFAIDHFFTKLLLLAPTLQTERGRVEAERRSERMKRLLEDLGEELGRPFQRP